LGYLFWLLAFVFWSYLFLVPISFSIASRHKETRLCLIIAIEVFKEKSSIDDKKLKGGLSGLIWLKAGLNAYDKLLSSQPNHPSLVDIDSYYDAAYSALLIGTENDRKRVLTSLKNMLKALGRNKKENNFKTFLFALARIKRAGRITWENRSVVVKTESRIERISRRCKPLVIYLVPAVTVIVEIIKYLL
jgi:hypothetical protein